MDHDVLVYKTNACPFCKQAMTFLDALRKERGAIQIRVIDANQDPMAFRQVIAQTGHKTVPQIFIDGNFVGGWDDLRKAAKSGRLDAYLDGGEVPKPEPKKRWFQRK